MSLWGPSHRSLSDLKWDRRFLRQCELIAESSKDPSTRVGAKIVDRLNRSVSEGYNGFPRGVEDTNERLSDRTTKYAMIIHAEPNAILFAHRDLTYCRIYTWPFSPCAHCAGMIIQAGIKQVISVEDTNAERAARWKDDWAMAEVMFEEAGVDLIIYPAAFVK